MNLQRKEGHNLEFSSKLLVGVVIIIGIFLLLSPFADPNPDGLEKAVGDTAPEGSAYDLGFLTDYGSEDSFIFQLIGNNFVSVILSGFIGVLLVIGIFSIPLIIIKRKQNKIPA